MGSRKGLGVLIGAAIALSGCSFLRGANPFSSERTKPETYPAAEIANDWKDSVPAYHYPTPKQLAAEKKQLAEAEKNKRKAEHWRLIERPIKPIDMPTPKQLKTEPTWELKALRKKLKAQVKELKSRKTCESVLNTAVPMIADLMTKTLWIGYTPQQVVRRLSLTLTDSHVRDGYPRSSGLSETECLFTATRGGESKDRYISVAMRVKQSPVNGETVAVSTPSLSALVSAPQIYSGHCFSCGSQ